LFVIEEEASKMLHCSNLPIRPWEQWVVGGGGGGGEGAEVGALDLCNNNIVDEGHNVWVSFTSRKKVST